MGLVPSVFLSILLHSIRENNEQIFFFFFFGGGGGENENDGIRSLSVGTSKKNKKEKRERDCLEDVLERIRNQSFAFAASVCAVITTV